MVARQRAEEEGVCAGDDECVRWPNPQAGCLWPGFSLDILQSVHHPSLSWGMTGAVRTQTCTAKTQERALNNENEYRKIEMGAILKILY